MLSAEKLVATFSFRGQRIDALAGVDLEIAAGEIFVLLGPSGCGKTTMLRSIAGLERPKAGAIAIDGSTVFSAQDGVFVPPERRPIAMVFQSYAIWPHMDVYQNIAFPLREGVSRLGAAEVRRRVGDVLDMLGLNALADRPVTTLSGGQQQRVALARAIALRPKVLLMDEPLSNLDHKLQVRLRAELKDLMHRLHLTTVYVTHNQAEAMEIGDRIAVMNRGRFAQLGAPTDIYRYPTSEFAARFIGDMNLIPARIREANAETVLADTAIGRLVAPARTHLRSGTSDGYFFCIRPEDIGLSAGGTAGGVNVLAGRIASSQFAGEAVTYRVAVDGAETALQVKTHHSVNFGIGTEVSVSLPREYCSVIDREAGQEDATDMAAFGTVIGERALAFGAS